MIIAPDFYFYVDKIERGEQFSFVRYGNGEWECVLDLFHITRSGSQRFSPSLREALIKTVTEQRIGNYYPAIQCIKYLELQPMNLLEKIKEWLLFNSAYPFWYCGDVFHNAAGKGDIYIDENEIVYRHVDDNANLYPLVKAISNYHVVVVGPPWLQKLPFVDTFVEVKPRDCWNDFEEIRDSLLCYRDSVISFSAGPTTKVLIHNLYPQIGDTCWLIDFGSLWDPYCGVNSRSYHREMSSDMKFKNMEGHEDIYYGLCA